MNGPLPLREGAVPRSRPGCRAGVGCPGGRRGSHLSTQRGCRAGVGCPGGRRGSHFSTQLGEGGAGRWVGTTLARWPCGSGSTCPTTGPVSPDGPPSPACVPSRASSAQRSPPCCGPRTAAPHGRRADRRRGARTWTGRARRRRPARVGTAARALARDRRGRGRNPAARHPPRRHRRPAGAQGACGFRRPLLGAASPLPLPPLGRPGLVDPLRRHDTVLVRGPLDVAAMVCRPGPGRPARLRRVLQTSRRRDDRPDPAVVRVVTLRGRHHRGDVGADAFCHSMVRALVGSVVPVGTGGWGWRRRERCSRPGPGPAGEGHARPRTLPRGGRLPPGRRSSRERAESQARVLPA